MRVRWIVRVAVAVLFGALGCAAAKTADLQEPVPTAPIRRFATIGPVLLVTNPTVETVDELLDLVDARMLSVDGLHIIGVHHSSDFLDTASAEALIRERGASWFSIETVDCALYDDPFKYSDSCEAKFSWLFENSDGIMFTGGPDLPSSDYGEAQSLLTVPRSLERTRFELALASALLGGKGWKENSPALLESKPDYLVLGICLGMQELNVALSGSLYQDIPFEVYGLSTYEDVQAEPRAAHRRYSLGRESGSLGRFVRHRLRAEPGWSARGLPDLDEGSPRILSAHHQAVERLGDGLEILATSRDQAIVEAVGHLRFPGVLGVQFHPEHKSVSAAALSQEGPWMDNASLTLHRDLWAWISRALAASKRAREESMKGRSPTPTGTPILAE